MTTMSTTWETATPVDVEAVAHLIESTYRAAGVPCPGVAGYVRDWVDAELIMVCRDRQRVWATVGVHEKAGEPGTAVLGGLALDPARQGQGYGRLLLLELLAKLRDAGITRAEAVTHDAMTHALGLYRSMGCVVTRSGGHWQIVADVTAVLESAA